MNECLQQGTDVIKDRTLHLAYRIANVNIFPANMPAIINAEKLPWQIGGSRRSHQHPHSRPLVIPEQFLPVYADVSFGIVLHGILMGTPPNLRVHRIA